MDQLIEQAKKIMLDVRVHGHTEFLPCTIGTRGHLHHVSSDKRRLIYVVPGAIQLIEQTYVSRLYRVLKADPECPMFFGNNVIPRLRLLMMKTYPKGHVALRTDFSAFDTTVHTMTLEYAFEIFREMVDITTYDGVKLYPAQQKRWTRVFEFVKEYFVNTPIMTPQGRLLWY